MKRFISVCFSLIQPPFTQTLSSKLASLLSVSLFSFSVFVPPFFGSCLADKPPLHQTKEKAFVPKVKRIATPSGETFRLECIY